MATNHTTNYQLNLWQPTDRFLREEFNENSQKIDAALKAEADARAAGDAALTQAVAQKADASTVAALAQTVAGKGNCRIVVGTYTGTGEYGKDHPVVLDFADTMGKAPIFLIVTSSSYTKLITMRGNTYHLDAPNLSSIYAVSISWSDTGVSWYNSHYASDQMNSEDTLYSYCALFD